MSRLPILMYHNVSNNEKDSVGLTVFCKTLENQFRYLREKGFKTYHFSDLENAAIIDPKSVVITFDDVTENQLVYAVPLLQKYDLKATFFIPFAYVGDSDLWNKGKEKIMSLEQLKDLDSCVELGLHSFAHKKYVDLTEDEINDDFSKCFEIIEKSGLKVFNALAYPFGNYPKRGPQNTRFKAVLQQNNVKFGLRIGNKVNIFPFKNPYEIMRIDIKGEDSMLKFQLKLLFGKLKLF